MRGSNTMARASATRWRWPPDSWSIVAFAETRRAGPCRAPWRRAAAMSALATPRRRQRIGDVARHRHVRKQRVVLEHHADVALVRRHQRHVAVAEPGLAAVGAHEARQHHQQGRLAGTGRAEQGDEFAAGDLEADVVERSERAVALGDVADRDRQRDRRAVPCLPYVRVCVQRSRSCQLARSGNAKLAGTVRCRLVSSHFCRKASKRFTIASALSTHQSDVLDEALLHVLRRVRQAGQLLLRDHAGVVALRGSTARS